MKNKIITKCSHCGKSIAKAKRSTRKYCDANCKQLAFYERKGNRNVINISTIQEQRKKICEQRERLLEKIKKIDSFLELAKVFSKMKHKTK